MANIKKAAPKPPTTRPADFLYTVASVAGLSGDLDLRTISKFPMHAPQRLTLLGGATALAVVLLAEPGDTSRTITVPINAVVVVNTPVTSLIKSGSGAIGLFAEWWSDSTQVNP